MMGLEPYEYQKQKRAVFKFTGKVDQKSRLTFVLVYNNRGLHVHGKQVSVLRLR